MKKTSKRTSASPKRSPAPHRLPPTLEQKSADAILAFDEFAKRERIQWYLFGAQAVIVYGVPRVTNDIDITVDLGVRTLADFIAPLQRAGFEPKFADEAFALATRVLPVVHQSTQWKIDLVLAGPGLEQKILEEARPHRVGRRKIRVISPEHLVVLKVLAGRPKDLQDVRGLLDVADLDQERIEQTLRDLEQALDQSDLRPLYARLRAEAKPKARKRPRGGSVAR